jgi:hypothetical protein
MNVRIQQRLNVPSFFTSLELIFLSLLVSTLKLAEKDERTMKVKLRNR